MARVQASVEPAGTCGEPCTAAAGAPAPSLRRGAERILPAPAQEPADIYHAGDDMAEAPTKVWGLAPACRCGMGPEPACLPRPPRRPQPPPTAPADSAPPASPQLESMGHETLQHAKERIHMPGATGGQGGVAACAGPRRPLEG